jgi:aromatic-L-amino-acid decarboxylase
LKLWYVMRYFGRERIQRFLRDHIAWAQRFAKLAAAHPDFEIVAPAPFSVVCFRYKGSDDHNRKILEHVNASGQAYISHTVLAGRYTLRLAIGNLGTTWADVEAVWGLIQQAASGVSAPQQQNAPPSARADRT